MKEKTKEIVVDEVRYQIRRFRPDVGSFILSRVLSAAQRAVIERMKSIGDVDFSVIASVPASVPEPELDPVAVTEAIDSKTRLTVTNAFGVMGQEDRSMIQRRCLESCSRLEGVEDAPMPLANANGTLVDDLDLTLRLELETLVFNFSDFFARGGLNALLRTPSAAPRT